MTFNIADLNGIWIDGSKPPKIRDSYSYAIPLFDYPFPFFQNSDSLFFGKVMNYVTGIDLVYTFVIEWKFKDGKYVFRRFDFNMSVFFTQIFLP